MSTNGFSTFLTVVLDGSTILSKLLIEFVEVFQQNVKWCGGIHGVSKMYRGLQKASKMF